MELGIDFSDSLFGDGEPVCVPDAVKWQPMNQEWVFSNIFESPPRQGQKDPTPNRAGKRKKRKKCKPLEDEAMSNSGREEHSAGEEIEWTTNHPSVGKKIEKVFEMQGTPETYIGEVISYLPPSKPHSADQLYKIAYDDDDEEDFDQMEFNAGRKAFLEVFVEKKH